MTIVQVSVEVDAPPKTVWKVVADPSNLPRWNRHIVSVRGVPTGGLEVGTEYSTEIRFMGMRTTSTSRVLELDAPKHSKVTLHGLVEGLVETWLEPLDSGGRTLLRHRVEYRFIGGPLGMVAARALNALGAPTVLKHGAEAQKRQVEELG